MGLIKCPECGKEISDKADVCIGCGFPIKKYVENREGYSDFKNEEQTTVEDGIIICKSCGEKNNKGDTYCKSCGTKLTDSDNIMFELTDDKKKVSKLSFVALVCSFLGRYSYIGAILAFIDICIRKKNKQYKFSYFAICVSIVMMLALGSFGSSGSDGSNDEPTQIETQETQSEETASDQKLDTEADTQKQDAEKNDTQIKKEKPKKQNKFVKDLVNDGLDEKVAKKAYKILKKKIGFKKLKYVDKMDGLTNYNIEADGADIVMTASDKVYRIFIPSSSYVFYEDGKVKLIAKRFNETTYTQSEASAYYIMAQQIIEGGLDDPNGVKFPSQTFSPEDIAIAKDGDLIAVKSYVDVKNYYGTKVRIDWIVQYTVTDIDSYSCYPNYVKIGDDSAGEYIKMK